jgi:hypothetical protein
MVNYIMPRPISSAGKNALTMLTSHQQKMLKKMHGAKRSVPAAKPPSPALQKMASSAFKKEVEALNAKSKVKITPAEVGIILSSSPASLDVVLKIARKFPKSARVNFYQDFYPLLKSRPNFENLFQSFVVMDWKTYDAAKNKKKK